MNRWTVTRTQSRRPRSLLSSREDHAVMHPVHSFCTISLAFSSCVARFLQCKIDYSRYCTPYSGTEVVTCGVSTCGELGKRQLQSPAQGEQTQIIDSRLRRRVSRLLSSYSSAFLALAAAANYSPSEDRLVLHDSDTHSGEECDHDWCPPMVDVRSVGEPFAGTM